MTDTSAMPVLEIMRQRFTSGNSIPVHSARITADEWDTIRAIIEKHQQPSVPVSELREFLRNNYFGTVMQCQVSAFEKLIARAEERK